MEPGELIAGRYRVERELGRGGMGAVYLAIDTRSSRQRAVAVKVAAASGIAHDQFLARFEREANIGCALGQEPGFVRAFDRGELDGTTVYMAMDLVDGARALDLRTGSLDERLSRLEEAAALVERAHALGVIHRDLKPANVLVARDGKAWLADFGLAKLRGEAASESEAPALTQTGHGMGTPQFMPPEQFDDAKSADERADVYALGVMLFVILTGRYPFDGHSAAEVLTKQMRAQMGAERAPRPRDHDASVRLGLDSLCAEATALDKAKRTQSVTIFLRELRRARGKLGKPSARQPAPIAAPASPEVAPTELGVEPSLPSIRTLPDLGPASEPPRTLPDLGPASGLAAAPGLAPRAGEEPIIRGGAGAQDSLFAEVLRSSAGKAFAVGGALFVLALLRLIVSSAVSGPLPPPPRGDLRWQEDRPDEIDLPTRPSATPDHPYPGEDADTAAIRKAALGNDPAAMLNLAIRLERGAGVTKNKAEALRWYQRSASGGDADAMLILGDLYLDGHDVPRSEQEARSWFERARALGNPDAGERLDAMNAERERARRQR